MTMPESLVFVREDGETLDLNDGVNIKLRHHDGFGIPDFAHQVVDAPGMPGDFWFGVKFPARVVTHDLTQYANGLAALQNLRASIIRKLSPALYTGTLRLTQTNGVTRYLDCVLAESLPMPTQLHVAQRAMMLSIRFRSVKDPFLYDPVQKTYQVTQGSGSSNNFMLPTFQFPFILSQSGVFNEVVHTYAGDVPTPVYIELIGPGIEPILRNETLDREVSFIGSGLNLSVGGVLSVDMDQRKRDIRFQGVNGWPYLRGSGFWWLQPGPNHLSFQVSGSTAVTSLMMRYFDRYLGV